jgi:cytidyltransferase-like protein
MKKIQNVFVSGSFDVLHLGHLHLLKYAKSLGESLIVSIESDEITRRSKDNKRPINNSNERKEFLESLPFVDKVLVFKSTEELKKQIQQNKIEVIVTGEEKEEKNFSELTKVVIYKKKLDKSTTSILKTYYKKDPPF